jgi:glycosyltransferase involved in cell wall biosynthesis
VKDPAWRLDQLLPNFSYGDAIGNHALALRSTFREGGFRSDVFAQMRHPKLRSMAKDYSEYLAADEDAGVCFYHFSIGSILSEFFGHLKARKVLIYHNITPPEYLRGVNRRAEYECRRGRDELRELAGTADLALADSEFNRRELESMGFPRTEVLPIIVDFEGYDAAPRKGLLKRFDDDAVNVLHVSRFVPNKKIEDVVKSFAVFKKVRSRARLFLVGTDVSFENYSDAVHDLVSRLGVKDVYFPGHVDEHELNTYYRLADIYLLMSEHEGFCVPLLESMHFGVPVIAEALRGDCRAHGSGGYRRHPQEGPGRRRPPPAGGLRAAADQREPLGDSSEVRVGSVMGGSRGIFPVVRLRRRPD